MFNDEIQVEVCPDCITVMRRKGTRLVCPDCHLNMPDWTREGKNLEQRIETGNKTGHRKPEADIQDRLFN